MTARRLDVLLCLGVVLALAVTISADQGGDGGPIDPLAYLWAVGLGLLMLVRRRHPLLVLGLTAVGFFTYYAAGFPAIGVAVPIAAALYSAAEMGHARAAVATGLGTLALSTGYRLAAQQSPALVVGYELLSHLLLIAAVIALGHSVRTSRQLRRRTDQVTRLLNRQRAMDDDARDHDDRLALARDLHDSIGHALTLAALHTEIAREGRGGEAQRRESLTVARAAVSDALSHLRRTVRVLRGGAGDAAAPGVHDLPGLARAAAAAGYDVQVDVEDLQLPSEVDAAVFRLVQEGITNALKHSNGRRLQVRVGREAPDRLLVHVLDDGRGATVPTLSPGHGLSGMRERVTDLGGQLDVRARDDGWLVHATIPLEAAP